MDLTEPSTPPDLAGHKILIADRDPADRGILAGFLRQQGCALAEADSGERALAVYLDFKPDLVLLDVALPGREGFETGRRLSQTQGEDRAPLIFLTAPGASAAGRADPATGGGDYLRKPLQPDEVVARVRTRLHLRQLVAQQQTLRAQLANAHTANRRFLGNAAHDLRNPLGSIDNLAEFLRNGTVGPLTADQLDLVNAIHTSSRAMLSLVNDLLDVVTIEAGELKIAPEPHHLTELLEQSVYLARITAAAKKIHLALTAPAAAPPVMIDAAKIKQVIDNLLTNAVKYSPPGSTVTVELHPVAGRCSFSVKDQGPGVPEKERDKLFKDFGRLSVRPTGGENSTGLGLAICRKIVEAHGGTIVAENLPEGGCEFRVTLPLAS